MKKNKIYILGSGGMAREVYQIYCDIKREANVCGFLVNTNKLKEKIIDAKKVIMFSDLKTIDKKCKLVNGIGSPLREEWIKELENENYLFDSIMHPSGVIGRNARLGKDLVVCANTFLSCDIKIGNHVIINVNSTVSHDVEIEDFVTISPGVSIGGRVYIGKGSFIGIGSCIIQNVKIGSNVLIGAGSVVVGNIPDNTLAYGNPAKPIKKITKSDWSRYL